LDDDFDDLTIEDELDFVRNSPPDHMSYLASSPGFEDDEVSSGGDFSDDSKVEFDHALLLMLKNHKKLLSYKYYVNYPPNATNNCEICISVFMSYVLPMFSSFVYIYDVDRTKNSWNRLIYEFKSLPSILFKIDQWISIAKDCVVFAFGTGMLSHVDLATQFILQFESILTFIFTHFSIPSVLVDCLINMWIMKTLFFLANDDKTHLSNSISSLYKLSTTYSDYILPLTKYKILSIMILLPENDCMTWFDHINTLGDEALNELPNLILLSSILNLRALNWSGSWEIDIPFENKNEKSKSLPSIFNQVIDQIDKQLKDNQENFPLDLLNYFESVLYSCKATISLLGNDNQTALLWSIKSLTIIKKLNFPFSCLINTIQPLIFIFKSLSRSDLEGETKLILYCFKNNYLKREKNIEYNYGSYPNPINLYNSSEGYFTFPLMKIEHCIFNDYGLDMSDIIILESPETCEYQM